MRACVLTSREARARGRVGAAGPAMGEPPRRPRELFLAGLAAAYLAAFVSLYLQIPGKRPGGCLRGVSRGILLPRYADRGGERALRVPCGGQQPGFLRGG